MRLSNNETGYGLVTVIIHWLTAITVIGLFVVGLWMVDLTYYDDWYQRAPYLHKSVGVLLFLLTVFRLLWRWKNIKPSHLQSHSQLEIKMASLAHAAIYLLLFMIMLSGYLISTADGRAVEVFGLFEVPAIIYGYDGQEDAAGVVHLVLAISLIALVSVHALAALKHHFVDKDFTLKRMLGYSRS